MRAAASPPEIDRLSVNQITVERWSLREAVEGCLRHGIPSIGLWRHKVEEVGVPSTARILREAGLKVSSLCRGGFFPAGAEERRRRWDDNRRAVDEAAELDADVLVLVCGGIPNRDVQVEGARAMVQEGISDLAPYAAERGVKLAIEPLHPMFAADRSVIVTLGQANRLAEPFPSGNVGVMVDLYHVWWDPELYAEIERARARIVGLQVSDWIVPLPDPLLGRGMMGDGVIDLRRIRHAVDATGYRGPVEVEILNQSVWERPGDEVLALAKERYLACV